MRFSRRQGMQFGVGALAGVALGGMPRLNAEVMIKDVATPKFEIEQGASLRVLRPAKFVQGDETLWLANTKKFTEATGVQVTVTSESWEDLRPKTAVAANVGTGPDVVLAWQEDPHLFPDKLVPLDDLTGYLGEKYGGWFPVCKTYGMNGGKWIAMPIGCNGASMVYRKSWLNEAGYDEVPKDFSGFLAMAKKLKASGHPIGFALGNAVGDGGWTDWILWGFDSSLVDENDKIAINNPNTIAALEYAKELSETFIDGTFSWLDPSNNKAFLAGEISLTSNGISVYYAAKNAEDPKMKEMASDIFHSVYPVGPIGKATQGALVINSCIFNFTKFPNAAKEYLRFMMEVEQYAAWQTASIGYWTHPLAAYDGIPFWSEDPKYDAYKDISRNALPQSYKGHPGEAAAAAKADMVVLNMFQSVCAGQQTPQEAMAEAERRARRYYKS